MKVATPMGPSLYKSLKNLVKMMMNKYIRLQTTQPTSGGAVQIVSKTPALRNGGPI